MTGKYRWHPLVFPTTSPVAWGWLRPALHSEHNRDWCVLMGKMAALRLRGSAAFGFDCRGLHRFASQGSWSFSWLPVRHLQLVSSVTCSITCRIFIIYLRGTVQSLASLCVLLFTCDLKVSSCSVVNIILQGYTCFPPWKYHVQPQFGIKLNSILFKFSANLTIVVHHCIYWKWHYIDLTVWKN